MQLAIHFFLQHIQGQNVFVYLENLFSLTESSHERCYLFGWLSDVHGEAILNCGCLWQRCVQAGYAVQWHLVYSEGVSLVSCKYVFCCI